MRQFFVFVLFLSSYCHGKLSFINLLLPNETDKNLNTVLMPIERESIKDCPLKYYKYGKMNDVKPAAGEPAFLKDFAHIAAIGWTEVDNSISWNCGGSLVTETFLLTAAHCTSDDLNRAPDVARMGDLNLYSNDDDQYAQQYTIVEIIRHPDHLFKARYNDLALMKLEKGINVTDVVTPACLWIDEKVRFPIVEAAGWGATGFLADKTPILLKVNLKPLENEACKPFYATRDRKLPNGILDSQICAGDPKMDTCPGDSGGPLQMRLLGNSKMTPFLIGITSFGKACGSGTPGVYTRIAPYRSWIESVVSRNFDPIKCAKQYVKYREYEDDVIISRSRDFITIDFDEAHMYIPYSKSDHKVSIIFGKSAKTCTGIIIEHNYVLTAAQCFNKNGPKPTEVTIKNSAIKIKNLFVHPGYKEGLYYNDIAILKLANFFKFSEELKPACLWLDENIPRNKLEQKIALMGKGPYGINVFTTEPNILAREDNTFLLPRVDIRTKENCTVHKDFSSNFPQGVKDNQLCAGNSLFLVPKSCEIDIGGSLERELYRYDRSWQHIFGINSFGIDCGFGYPAIASKVASHFDWINSIIVPSISDKFHYSEGDQGDACYHTDNTKGICVPARECPNLVAEYKKNRVQINFCSLDQDIKVCCPLYDQNIGVIKNVKNEEIDSCENLYSNLYEKIEYIDDFSFSSDGKATEQRVHPSIGIVWSGLGVSCVGVLVTKTAILTSESCLRQGKGGHKTVKFGQQRNEQEVDILNFVTHPNYQPSSKENDLAVIKIRNTLQLTPQVIPACIWKDQTKTPFDMRKITLDSINGLNKTTKRVTPVYKADCQTFYRTEIKNTELCVEEPFIDQLHGCPVGSAQLLYNRFSDNFNTRIGFAVGAYSFRQNCNEEVPAIYTRYSHYVDWIKSVL